MKETTAEGRCGRERKKNRRAFWLTNQWSVLFLAPPPQSWDTDSALVLSNENVYETWEFVTVLWRSVIYFLFKTCNVINIICCAQKFSSLTNDTTLRDHASIRSVCVRCELTCYVRRKSSSATEGCSCPQDARGPVWNPRWSSPWRTGTWGTARGREDGDEVKKSNRCRGSHIKTVSDRTQTRDSILFLKNVFIYELV